MNKLIIKRNRVRASVNPTNRIIAKRARDSSGRIPLYNYSNYMKFINLSVRSSSEKWSNEAKTKNEDDWKLEQINKSELMVREKHIVYTKSEDYYLDFGNTRNPASDNINNLPLNSEDFTELNKFIKDKNTELIRGGIILINTIPEYFLGGNRFIFPKCLSKVNITLFSELANSATSESLAKEGGSIMSEIENHLLQYVVVTILLSISEHPKNPTNNKRVFLISNPCFLSKFDNLYGIFASQRSLGMLEGNIPFTPDYFRSIGQRSENSFFSDMGKVIFKDFINRNPCCKQFNYLPNHDSCPFESWLAMTNFSVCNNIFIDLDSHDNDNVKEYLNVSGGGK